VKKPVERYVERVRNKTNALTIDVLSSIPPWQAEQHYVSQLSNIKSLEGAVTTKIMENLKQEFTKISKSAHDRAIALLCEKLTLGSILNAYTVTIVETKMMNFKSVCSYLGICYTHALKLRHCFLFSKKYNLILYSGCAISDLMRNLTKLNDYLETHFDEALLLTGNTLLKGPSFTFDQMSYSYGPENMETRQHAITEQVTAQAQKMNLKKK